MLPDTLSNAPHVYIAGPMKGLPSFNVPAFDAAANAWRDAGFAVINPADVDREKHDLDHSQFATGDVEATGIPYETFLREAVIQVAGCYAIAVLPGWQQSTGASLEVHVGRALKMPIYDARYPDAAVEVHETVLEEAMRVVYGARQKSYDHPRENFAVIAALWSEIFDEEVSIKQVGLAMITVKIAREIHSTHRDNFTDIAGYAEATARAIGLDP